MASGLSAMDSENNLVKSENVTITSDYPILNVYIALSERSLIKTEKPDISVEGVLQPDSYGTVIKTEPAPSPSSDGNLIKTEKAEPREKNTRRNLTEPLCLAENGDPTALVENHDTPKPQWNQLMESVAVRTAEKRFICDFCDKRFTRAHNLTIHKRCHTGEKPFVCDVCGKRFKNTSNLVTHKRTHTGEKPFVCDFCSKRFTRASSLVLHNRSHTGEKPFVCGSCEKRFSQASSLVVHYRSHTGEKPFGCNLCEKRFSQSFSLVRHKRSHMKMIKWSAKGNSSDFTREEHKRSYC